MKSWLKLKSSEGTIVGARIEGLDLNGSDVTVKVCSSWTHYKVDGKLVGYVKNGIALADCSEEAPKGGARVWKVVKDEAGNVVGQVKIGAEEQMKELI